MLKCWRFRANRAAARCQSSKVSANVSAQKSNASSIPSREQSFAHERTGHFVQQKPVLTNPYEGNELIQDYILRHCPPEHFERVNSDLSKCGERIVNEVDALGDECERVQPYLKRTDGWGERIDEIVVSPAWYEQHRVSAEEGLIAIGYENESGSFSRVHQMAKNMLTGASSGLYNCPLAMTDGAAMISKSQRGNHDFLEEAYQNLTSRDGAQFWTSGQWMTEKAGGSDVGDATHTEARIIDDKNDKVTEGSRGLSMFYLKIRDAGGKLNGIQVHKLKEKLGTKQLPTAELILDGCEAHLVGEPGRGIPLISGMLTVTRIHNAVAACSFMRRMVHLARDYATKRTAFKKTLSNHAAHVSTLARMEVDVRAAELLSLEVSRLFGKSENGQASKTEQDLMRILTPLAKAQTAKQGMVVCSEGLECFGGQGYIEETPMPRLFRDAQVLPIWEGTSTVMSLDVLRSIQKSSGSSLQSLLGDIQKKLSASADSEALSPSRNKIATAVKDILRFLKRVETESMEFQLKSARDFAFSLAKLYQATLLLDHAAFTRKESDIYAANLFAKNRLNDLIYDYDQASIKNEFDLVFANYQN
ncbi:Oidioi.mRNA.OKI2018_I69.XSR.g14029.t1.cds [Oikopleura dioica]|uniref:Oidioi.mRNA.OKI2018_I69.XSR.g14029.t1.cds n=1 Tax=Oikopleura dioica TaxID=34765 RepID=A0ABN7S8N2_OIKDI|nr:Oidioi.mRNA.OKI2018_I69.XSR.g14029.t1.cds [Oikopleura dioica]